MKNNLNIGKLGEDLACRFLEQKGFSIVERNFRRKAGEIDIIALKTLKNSDITSIFSRFSLFKNTKNILYFIEVKAIIKKENLVSRETNENIFIPEDNIHPLKLKKISRVTEIYLKTKRKFKKFDFRFAVIAIRFSADFEKAHVRFYKNFSI